MSSQRSYFNGWAENSSKYFVSLPTQQAHQGHPVCQAASFCQRIHLLILNKISELVLWGIDETKEVQRALNHYVKHTLPIEHNITPTPTDRAFYSLLNDKNHVGKAKHALKLSKLDQVKIYI